MPFHFWSVVFFVFGCVVGSFLNVVIHRLPIGQSVVSPPSHCPHCKYSIPGYLNIPLVTWLVLGGKCANCRAPISMRYFLVELLTGIMFLVAWLAFGHNSVAMVFMSCILISGLIAGSFIDFEHFIIPDEITIGGTVVGFLCSFLVPALHEAHSPVQSLIRSFFGIVVGAGMVYFVLRMGKLFLGQQKFEMASISKVIFTETQLVLPDQSIPYEELFYRKSDTVKVEASTAELSDRCYRNVDVRLTPVKLKINDEEMDPAEVPYLEVMTNKLWLPREAMGLGDVKLMAAIGAFLGWQAAIFTFLGSAVIGSIAGVTMIALGKWGPSSRLQYVPYISMAAVIWLFGGHAWWNGLWVR